MRSGICLSTLFSYFQMKGVFCMKALLFFKYPNDLKIQSLKKKKQNATLRLYLELKKKDVLKNSKPHTLIFCKQNFKTMTVSFLFNFKNPLSFYRHPVF